MLPTRVPERVKFGQQSRAAIPAFEAVMQHAELRR
jgi:hypothetical protein